MTRASAEAELLTRKIGWQKPASFRQVIDSAQDIKDGIGIGESIDNNLINPNSDHHDRVALRNAMEREGLGSTRILADSLVPEELRPAPIFDVDALVADLVEATPDESSGEEPDVVDFLHRPHACSLGHA